MKQNIFNEKIKGSFSSLYLINQNNENIIVDFFTFLNSRDIKIIANQNLIHQKYDLFSIDDSRAIGDLHSQKSDKEKIFVIEAKYFTHDAQNALLKIFEDTKIANHFFIFSDSVGEMLDTVLSRAVFIDIKNTTQDFLRAKKFLSKKQDARIKEVADIIVLHKNDIDSASLRDDAKDLVNSLEILIHQSSKLTKEDSWRLGEIIKARKYLSTPGASVKMILEHLSLVL